MADSVEPYDPKQIKENRFPSRRSTVMSPTGMVVTEQPLAAFVGLRILQDGGNAIDAAIATAAMLNVVNPAATGIGGDMFALVYLADEKKVRALNASGRAPMAATLDYFHQKGIRDIPQTGMLPVTVPGALDGWVKLLAEHGTMDLGQVLAPAILYAEEGFPVSEITAGGWQRSVSRLSAHPDTAKNYLIDYRAPRAGELFKQPNLGQTFRRVAEGGRDVFYRGEIAEKIIRFSQANGGLLSHADLASYHSIWVEPISTSYRGRQVYECPPNGQGIAVLLALNLIQEFELDRFEHNSAEYFHILIEAMKMALADTLNYVADPEFIDVPVAQLLSRAYTMQRRAQISLRTAAEELRPGHINPGDDTAYLTVVDKDRNAVSLINSLYMGFGSSLVVGDTGICLHNRGNLFSLDPNHANCIAPGKRPFNTIIPAMVLHNDQLLASFGVTGGFKQPQTQVQVLCNLIDFGMPPQMAVDAPRFRFDLEENQVVLEKGVEDKIRWVLEGKGHTVDVSDTQNLRFGCTQLIVVDPDFNTLLGASDPQRWVGGRLLIPFLYRIFGKMKGKDS